MVGAWFPSPASWETQPLPYDTARCGFVNPQHRESRLAFSNRFLVLRGRELEGVKFHGTQNEAQPDWLTD